MIVLKEIVSHCIGSFGRLFHVRTLSCLNELTAYNMPDHNGSVFITFKTRIGSFVLCVNVMFECKLITNESLDVFEYILYLVIL